MIHHEWRAEVAGAEREELDRLLSEAAGADAESGFSSFGLDDPLPPGTRYLLVWLSADERSGRPAAAPATLAGCLRLEPGPDPGAEPGTAEVRLVVHPELRARGIATLLFEQVGLDVGADGGWAGSGCTRLACWARGNHPAAQRLALRFADAGVRRDRAQWRLVVPLSGTDEPAAAVRPSRPGRPGVDGLWRRAGHRDPAPRTGQVLLAGPREHPHGGVWFDAEAAEPTDLGPAGLLRAVLVDPEHAEDGTRATLVDASLAALRAGGARVGLITVGDRERALLADCRIAGFQHDRTDCRYVVP